MNKQGHSQWKEGAMNHLKLREKSVSCMWETDLWLEKKWGCNDSVRKVCAKPEND